MLYEAAFAKMDTPTYRRDTDYSTPPLAAAALAALGDYVGTDSNDLYRPLSVT